MDRVGEWLDSLSVAGLSPRTISAYGWQVRKFFETSPPAEVKLKDLNAYLARKRESGWSDSSIKLACNSFRSYFKFVLKSKSPARALKIPRPKPKPQRTLTATQALAVIASCDTSTARGQRDLALLCLMLDTGLRSNEICNLQLKNVDMGERRLQAIVKGGSVKIKAFSTYTASQLERWLSHRTAIAKPETQTFFCGVGGLKPGTKLTPYGMRCIFRVIAKAAGLDRFAPHDLRRSFATLTIRFGASTRMVQQQGGWNNLEELERYTQALTLEDVEKFLPVGRLMGV